MPVYVVRWVSVIAADSPLHAAVRAQTRIAHMSHVQSPVGYESSSTFEVEDPTAGKAWIADVELLSYSETGLDARAC